MAKEIEDAIENLSTLDMRSDPAPEGAELTLWVPATYKEKYATLQERSNRKAGKALKQIFLAGIDRLWDATQKKSADV